MDINQPQNQQNPASAVQTATPVVQQTGVAAAPAQPAAAVAANPAPAAPAAQDAMQSALHKLETKPIVITITLPTNAYFLSGIRDFTLGLIKNMTEFSEQWAFRFQSVVDELCNNAIEYGSSPGQEIKLTFISDPHKAIEIHVEDSGTGKNKINSAELKRLIEERRNPSYQFTGIRGRGLAKIVAEWTDELVVEDTEKGGLKIKIKKFLNDPRIQQEMSKYLESPTHLVLN